ncbi:hypothetical protein AB0B01_17655 [Streptomyces sp. NPDC044571]|uniref:SCO7613 C-terminal domain-containing membrane protein n=1 Tax=Streptomyces sp. NPDC044571 TaxID=3155371 RepID=UPI003406262F
MAPPPPDMPRPPDMPLPPAEELALIDRELAQLDHRRSYLLARREWLLRLPVPAGWPAPAPAPARPKEASAPGAQNVLLTLGAVLLAVAALAFTLLSWGSLGIAGRSAVLALVTAGALGAPALLLRRGLRSTAESVAAVGLLLTVLDAYAVYAVGVPDADGTAYAAGAAAVLAALWAGYGRAAAKLVLPWPAAVLAAQLPLPLAAEASGAGGVGLGWALLVTAALDAALALAAAGSRLVRLVRLVRLAWVPAAALGAGALLTGLSGLPGALSAGAAAGPATLLAGCAVLGVAVAWREPSASGAALAGGLAAVAAAGGTLRPELAPDWAVVALLLLALPLPAVGAASGLPAAVRRGLTRAGAGVAALVVLWALSAAALRLASRAEVLREVWAATTPVPQPWGPGPAAAVALLVAAAAGWAAARALPYREPAVVAVVCGWAGLFTAPMFLGLPVAVVLAAQLAVTAAAGVGALRVSGGPGVAAGVCALVGAVDVSVAALDGRTATVAVFGLLSAGGAAAAAYGAAAGRVRACGAGLAVGYAGATVAALSALWGLAPAWWALPLLVVPATVAALGPRLGVVRVPAEVTAGAVGLGALLLAGSAGPARPLSALVCALAGVVCAGAAVREERRSLGWAAGVLGVAAAWIRLAASGVAVPEAYALPVTLPALAVGYLRRRRDPQASSWTAYGPGLAATLLPSLAALWGDPHWLRPLLLGGAALGVTLAGAHRRLQAPLVLGGAALAAVAVHELAPYVVQVVGALPRWLPPALAGLLLLLVGATYEKRLRDARRLRAALGRLR